MGIPIVPPDKIAGVGCATCFDVDQTPEFLHCAIGNIWFNPAAVPPLPPPPSGVFTLTYSAPCGWNWVDGFWQISYLHTVAGSVIKIREHTTLAGVVGSDVACNSWFELTHRIGPPPIYDDGFALVTMTSDCPIVSLSALAESVGLEPGADLLADPFVAPDEMGVIRYARKQDATNIKIMIDCS